ncbi:MAG: hypothetical protein MJY68_10090 [Bacteroidaceae bacterium]|nr:hypothetical protein [Bacteroidaceae bacterium]
MKKNNVLYLSLILCGTIVSAQDFNDFRRQQQESFNAFKKKATDDIAAYRNKLNEEFAKYIETHWKVMNGERPMPEPNKVPEIPPVVSQLSEKQVSTNNKIDVYIDVVSQQIEEPKPIEYVEYAPKPQEKKISFTFYGTEGIIRFDDNNKALLNGSKEGDVSRFWKELSSKNYDNILADCLNQKTEMDLCDWAYFKMTETVSEKIYGKTNEAVVLHFWLLSQSGFKARLGCDNGNIHLLLHTNEMIFNKPYWNLNDGLYFLLDGSSVEKMSVMSMSFPETNALRLSIKNQNRFRSNDSEPRVLTSKNNPDVSAKVICNYNYLAFMNDYPISAIEGSDDTDLMKYVYTPLSQSAKDELYPALRQKIEGKNEEETANILLDFVQTAFAYKTDNEVWGLERPFFPEETLYYPYCDCEDRAILFCRLVTDLMGLKTALVSYPGHVAAAVQFDSEIPGDYFNVNGTRFLICDPTYINAPIGKSMPRNNNSTAKVYPL